MPRAAIAVTTRLTLRPVEPDDLVSLERTWTDPMVRRHLGGPLSPEAVAVRRAADVPRDAFTVADPAGVVLGFCYLGHYRTGDVELSYTFLPEHWGHGYAREACAAVLEHAFREDVALDRVVAVTQATNSRSRRLLGLLGMVETDRFVEFGEPQVMYAKRRAAAGGTV